MKLILLAFSAIILAADAKIIAAVVIPHGDFAFDPSLVNYENGSRELHDTSVEVGKMVMNMNPDIIFLSTPHGMNLNRDFLIWGNSNASGFAMLGDDLRNASFPSYKVELKVPVARDVAIVGGLGNRYPDLPIGWGEVIPLQFFKERLAKGLSKMLLFSQPARRDPGVRKMIPELLQVGAALFDYLHAIPQTIAFTVSVDLAHTHTKEGPFGFSPNAVPFDNACAEWAVTMQAKPLLETAAAVVDEIVSCGYAAAGRISWQSKLYSNFHPTYYGMMVATFLPK